MVRAQLVKLFGDAAIQSGTSIFLLLVLMGDLAFIGLHVLLAWDSSSNSLFALGRDRGYAEFYQYVKFFWIIILLLIVAIRAKSVGYIAWILVFSYLLLDDALRIHELVGDRIGAGLGLRPYLGFRPKDQGQLIFAAIVAGLILSVLAFFYVRGSSNFRLITERLLLLVVAFALFSVVVDAMHTVTSPGTLGVLLGIAEDGGEMLIVSLITGFAFSLAARQKSHVVEN